MLDLGEELKATLLGLIFVLGGFLTIVYGFENIFDRGTYLAIGFILMLIGVWILFTKFKQWIHGN